MTVLAELRAAGVQSPYDVLDWGLALDGSLLASGETITYGSWSLPSEASGYGVELTDLGLATGDDGTYAVWARISVAAASQSHARWSGRGTTIYPTAMLTTNRDRTWWREVPIIICRGAWNATPRVLVIRP